MVVATAAVVVNSNTNVTSVISMDTLSSSATLKVLAKGAKPCYLCDFLFDQFNTSEAFSPIAYSSFFAKPVPHPPSSIVDDLVVHSTITALPNIFKIVTPIKVDSLWNLLTSHPNQPFVNSICKALSLGFWPWAEFPDDYPIIVDKSDRPPQNDAESTFLESQHDIEIASGRFSESFGPDLLPGMVSIPIHAVPKTDENLHMVMDHNAGKYTLNACIPCSSIAGAPLDNLKDLSDALLEFCCLHGPVRLTLFKSDVKGAHRLMPVCFKWQMKQINTINGHRHTDRCTCFGDSGSAKIWTSFFSLILWIAIYIKFIKYIFAYADNAFSFEWEGLTMWYEPYQRSKQSFFCFGMNLAFPMTRRSNSLGMSSRSLVLRLMPTK
jgi:hypothetical protein